MATVKINVSMPVETYNWLEFAAREVDLTVPALIRVTIGEFQERHSMKEPKMTDAAIEQMNAVVASLMEQDRAAAEKAANG